MTREEFVDVYSQNLTNLHEQAIRNVGNWHTAWDVVQDVGCKQFQIFEGMLRDRLKTPPDALRWLLACVTNRALDYCRRLPSRRDCELPMPAECIPDPYSPDM